MDGLGAFNADFSIYPITKPSASDVRPLGF